MESCQVLQVKVAVANISEAVKWIEAQLEQLKGQYVTFANTHSIIMAHDSEKYCKVQGAAAIVFADGYPVAGYQRKKGYKNAERVAGPDFMSEIFKISVQRHYRHYFYGSSKQTLKNLKLNLEKNYPGIEVAGMFSPPYEKNLRKDYREDIDRINKAHADFVWIGLGAPKQEYWMYQQKGKVNGVMLGVGAGFDFHGGVVKRAPIWMQRCGLEWLYRLCQEPGRLAERYWRTNSRFIILAIRELLKR